MRPLSLTQLAAWTNADRIGGDAQIDSIATDSRAARADTLFVALLGERVDGHDYVAQAHANGAAAALVARRVDVDVPQLVVDDPLLAIGRIAAHMRRARTTRVIALTGSNGKTSVKTLTASILAKIGNAYANPGNRNNELGMPLALIDQPEAADHAVYEMGAGQPGDIAYLADIAQPQVGLVNNIGPAHLERMGSLLGIAQTKGAIYAALPADGVAVVNADDAFAPWFDAQIGGRCRVLRFGIDATADVRAADLRLLDDGSRFRLVTPAGSADVTLGLVGRHNVSNALAATSLALAVGAPLEAIVDALHGATAVPGRQQSHRLGNGALLIDDSYNANPGSVAAAIATLAAAGGTTWLVLGDMRELGADAEKLHADVGAQARTAGIKTLWTTGALSAHAAAAFGPGANHYATQAELIAALQAAIGPDVRCLVKGSRGSRMDRVADALLGRMEAGHAA